MPTIKPEEKAEKGIVFNVQRFTIHDGPGTRTELFLKGCPLRCRWCSNPESYERYPQVGVYGTRCIGVSKCGLCLKACPKAGENVLIIEDDKVVGIDRTRCDNCLKCQDACPSDAMKLWGQVMTVEEAMKVIRADRAYYERSGGGVTLSGGEALLQWQFCRSILKACREEHIHTCVESALHVDTAILDEILPYTDLFITDIKQMDSAVHQEQTGVGNSLILKNIKKVVDENVPLIVRIPIIPGFNDTETFIDAASAFILNELGNKIQMVQLLRFRPMGEEKGDSLNMPYRMKGINPDRTEFEEFIKGLLKRMTDRGIPAMAGSTVYSSRSTEEGEMQ